MLVYLCYVRWDDGWEESTPRLCKITSDYGKAWEWKTFDHGEQMVAWFESMIVEE